MAKFKTRLKPTIKIKKDSYNKTINNIEDLISGAIYYATNKTQDSLQKLIIEIIKNYDLQTTNLFNFLENSAKKRGIKSNQIKSTLNKIKIDVKKKMFSGIKYKQKRMYFIVGKKDKEKIIKFIIPIYFLPFEVIGEAYSSAITQEAYNEQNLLEAEINIRIDRMNKAAKQGLINYSRGPFGIRVPLTESMVEFNTRVRETLNELSEISSYAPMLLKSSLAAEIYSYIDPTATVASYFDSFEPDINEEQFFEYINEEDFFKKYSATNVKSVGKEKLLGGFYDQPRNKTQETKDIKIKFKKPKKLHEITLVSLEKDILKKEEEIIEYKNELIEAEYFLQETIMEAGKVEGVDVENINNELENIKQIKNDINEAISYIKKTKKTLKGEKGKKAEREAQLRDLFEFALSRRDENINDKLTDSVSDIISIYDSRLTKFEERIFRKGKRGGELRITSSKKQRKIFQQETRKAKERAYEYFRENLGQVIRENLDPIVEIYNKSIGKLKILLQDEFQKQFLLYIKSKGAKLKTSSGKGGETIISDLNRALKNAIGKNVANIVSDAEIIFEQLPKEGDLESGEIVNAAGFENSRRKIIKSRQSAQNAYDNIFKNISKIESVKISTEKGVIKRGFLKKEAERAENEAKKEKNKVSKAIKTREQKHGEALVTENFKDTDKNIIKDVVVGEKLSDFTIAQNILRELRAYKATGTTITYKQLMDRLPSNIEKYSEINFKKLFERGLL